MRRADRLFRIVQRLRGARRALTARSMAIELEVSERTVYRDIADLVASGVPIRGEAGVGYAIDASYDLPPLMFTVEEIEALVLGARMVETWCDRALASAARDVLAKVEQVLPRRVRDRITATALFVPESGWSVPGGQQIQELRGAIREQRKARFCYQDAEGRDSERIVHPLGLFFWGAVATLGAWCELRQAFRTFRVDRIEALTILDERFTPVSGTRLEDYLSSTTREQES